jgi:hypothetical protein
LTSNTNLIEWNAWAAANTSVDDRSQRTAAQAAQVAYMLGTAEKAELIKAATTAVSIGNVAFKDKVRTALSPSRAPGGRQDAARRSGR